MRFNRQEIILIFNRIAALFVNFFVTFLGSINAISNTYRLTVSYERKTITQWYLHKVNFNFNIEILTNVYEFIRSIMILIYNINY